MASLAEVFPGFGKKVTFGHDYSKKTLQDIISNLNLNKNLKSLAHSYGIDIQTVSWEDTARNKNSCWGPNISDMTLNTQGRNMPIFRKPNYADVTTEVDIDKFNVVVGNENGKDLSKITLKEYLENISKYTNNEKVQNMYLERDSKILSSSQACILPLVNGEVEFNVRLYNYQTYKNNPAVLVIVASSQGTSCQIIDSNDSKLYFNNNNQASNFLAMRLKDDRKKRGVALEGEMTQEEKERNVLYIFQIPLKQKEVSREVTFKKGGWKADSCGYKGYGEESDEDYDEDSGYTIENSYKTPMSLSTNSIQLEALHEQRAGLARRGNIRGFDNAVLRAGDSHGQYYGTNNLELIRDDRYPIRCTIQFYKVTDNEEIPQDEIVKISEQINKIYNLGSNTSSLVYGKTERVTEPKLPEISAPNKYFSGWTSLF